MAIVQSVLLFSIKSSSLRFDDILYSSGSELSHIDCIVDGSLMEEDKQLFFI